MNTLDQIFEQIIADPRYLQNIRWGKPRPGHPEGTIAAHIQDLENNLTQLADRLSPRQVQLLRILIHVHDTFKPEAAPNVPISDPKSHASLAAKFLSEFVQDTDLLTMVQLHDEPFALWRQHVSRGSCDGERLDRLLNAIDDWETFSAFLVIDNHTAGKSDAPLRWFWEATKNRVTRRVPCDALTDARGTSH